MKRYKVWALCGKCHRGDEVILDFPDEDSEGVCEAACTDAMDTLIGNCFDTGFDPIIEEETKE